MYTKNANVSLTHSNVLVLIVVSIIVLLCYGDFSVVSYLYTILIFYFGNLFFPKKLRYYNFVSFEIYLFLALFIYTIQYVSLPSYHGLSGPEGGIGTDDIRYYEKIADIPLKVSSTAGWIESFSFSDFLRFIYPFRVVSPLNIIIINLLGIAYLPGLTYILTQHFSPDTKTSRKAAILVLLCPSLWSNGLIIMRDVWTVSLSMLIFILLLKRKYLYLIFPIMLLCYLRFGSVAFVIIGILIIIKFQIFNKSELLKITYWIIIGIIILMFIACISIISDLTGGKVEASLFRESFISMLISNDADGIVTKIAQMPAIIRTPLLFLFFYFTPFIKFKAFTLGVFNIRTILDTLFTASWFLLLSPFIFKYIYTSFSSVQKNLRILTWISIYFALALSIISLQVRHKVIMMPFFAIMAAIGMSQPKSKYNQVIALATILIIFFEILFALR